MILLQQVVMAAAISPPRPRPPHLMDFLIVSYLFSRILPSTLLSPCTSAPISDSTNTNTDVPLMIRVVLLAGFSKTFYPHSSSFLSLASLISSSDNPCISTTLISCCHHHHLHPFQQLRLLLLLLLLHSLLICHHHHQPLPPCLLVGHSNFRQMSSHAFSSGSLRISPSDVVLPFSKMHSATVWASILVASCSLCLLESMTYFLGSASATPSFACSLQCPLSRSWHTDSRSSSFHCLAQSNRSPCLLSLGLHPYPCCFSVASLNNSIS